MIGTSRQGRLYRRGLSVRWRGPVSLITPLFPADLRGYKPTQLRRTTKKKKKKKRKERNPHSVCAYNLKNKKQNKTKRIPLEYLHLRHASIPNGMPLRDSRRLGQAVMESDPSTNMQHTSQWIGTVVFAAFVLTIFIFFCILFVYVYPTMGATTLLDTYTHSLCSQVVTSRSDAEALFLPLTAILRRQLEDSEMTLGIAPRRTVSRSPRNALRSPNPRKPTNSCEPTPLVPSAHRISAALLSNGMQQGLEAVVVHSSPMSFKLAMLTSRPLFTAVSFAWIRSRITTWFAHYRVIIYFMPVASPAGSRSITPPARSAWRIALALFCIPRLSPHSLLQRY